MADAIVHTWTCKKCGCSYPAYGRCAPCRKLTRAAQRQANKAEIAKYRAEYREKNREKITEREKAYYADPVNRARKTVTRAANYLANADARRAYSREYYQKNKEAVLAQAAEYRARSKAKIKARAASYRIRNPEKLRAQFASWAARNPDANRVRVQNRRVARKKMGGKLSKDLAAKLFKLQRGKCACCGQNLGEKYHLDHIVPLARGGAHEDSNMQLLRDRCNQEKWATDPIDFMQQRGFLL